MAYSRGYSFGHYNPTIKTEYLQIFTGASREPLEMKRDHMIFVKDDDMRMTPMPAASDL